MVLNCREPLISKRKGDLCLNLVRPGGGYSRDVYLEPVKKPHKSLRGHSYLLAFAHEQGDHRWLHAYMN